MQKGYKEKHDLVVVNGSDEPHNCNEQQEHTHRYDAPYDVDAGHQAETLTPRCHCDEQQPHHLQEAQTFISQRQRRKDQRATHNQSGEVSTGYFHPAAHQTQVCIVFSFFQISTFTFKSYNTVTFISNK